MDLFDTTLQVHGPMVYLTRCDRWIEIQEMVLVNLNKAVTESYIWDTASKIPFYLLAVNAGGLQWFPRRGCGGGATFFRSTMPIAKAWLVAHTGRKESNCPTASQGPCPVLQAIRIQRANSKTCKHKQPSTWEERWRLLATLVWCEVAGPTMAKKFQRQQGCHYLLLIKRNRIFIAKHQGSGEFQG
jgi:hypothetical protein